MFSLSREPLVAGDLVDDLIHRYDAPRDLSDDFEPHGYCPPANGLIDVLEQQVSYPSFSSFLKIKNHQPFINPFPHNVLLLHYYPIPPLSLSIDGTC
jgi:hypothetical protein